VEEGTAAEYRLRGVRLDTTTPLTTGGEWLEGTVR
jgi:hypothetical protein